VVWVSPGLEARWLEQLPVRALWGVGPATAAKLRKLGLNWVRDLAKVDRETLARHVGSSLAASLAAYAHGEDYREVVVDREVKSVGHDQTFARSLEGSSELIEAAKTHAGVVARALRDQGRVARTITVVLRFDDLTSISRSQTLPFGLDDEVAILAIAEALIESVDLPQSVRLLGIHASSLLGRGDNHVQLSFALHPETSKSRERAQDLSLERQIGHEALRDAVDEVRRRFGSTSLGTAAELKDEGVDIATQRGRHAFGPERTDP
jgi:DNA polymerase-4